MVSPNFCSTFTPMAAEARWVRRTTWQVRRQLDMPWCWHMNCVSETWTSMQNLRLTQLLPPSPPSVTPTLFLLLSPAFSVIFFSPYLFWHAKFFSSYRNSYIYLNYFRFLCTLHICRRMSTTTIFGHLIQPPCSMCLKGFYYIWPQVAQQSNGPGSGRWYTLLIRECWR